MKIIGKTENSAIATVYLAEFKDGRVVEFVESIPPPFTIAEKWVLIVSSLFGCPVKCLFCDSGWHYLGKLTKNQILNQIDFLVKQRFPNKIVNSKKFKIQFARSGEPSLNSSVIEVLDELPKLYCRKNILPSVSTIAPKGTDSFFEQLIEVKSAKYNDNFQMQFSIHSTDESERNRLIQMKKWSLKEIANYGLKFRNRVGKKIALNFALYKGYKITPEILSDLFPHTDFIIKLTPLNPTIKSQKNGFTSESFDSNSVIELIESLRKYKFDVIVSIGEYEENKIGSNCGQYLQQYLNSQYQIHDAYKYKIEKHKIGL